MVLLLSGCASAPPPSVQEDIIPVQLMARAMAAPVEEQPNILSALVVLVEAGFFWAYGWDEPTTGTPVVKYTVTSTYDVVTNASLVLNVDKSNFTMRVAGIDALDRQGPYSVNSDTTNVRIWE